ncbi:MAG: hypothetical protein AB1698_20890 [Pseudomonadota bacterium]
MSAALDAERIRANLQDGVAAAASIAMSSWPRREITGVSVDQTLNMAGAVVLLDTICGTAVELLVAMEHVDLTDRASLARHALAGLLEQAGYVQFIEPKDEHNG